MKLLKWRLLVALRLDAVNETGKQQKVGGSSYSIVVQPGERVVFDNDDAPAGY